jgi:pantetheine-phosphate adenylyltransferase
MRAAIYPGSFDPMTNGHLSLIQRGLRMFDKLIVAIAVNPKKTPMFSVEERAELITVAIGGDSRVEVDHFDGLLVHYAARRGINVVLRGLRAVSDFEFEFQLANMKRKLASDLETVFMMTGEDYFYVSSNLVREVAAFGGNVEGMVPDNVLEALRRKHPRVDEPHPRKVNSAGSPARAPRPVATPRARPAPSRRRS